MFLCNLQMMFSNTIMFILEPLKIIVASKIIMNEQFLQGQYESPYFLVDIFQ